MKSPKDQSFHTRRQFLRTSLLGGALAPTVPLFFGKTFLTQDSMAAATPSRYASGKDSTVLVVLQLVGGNDGLNTLVPYADDAYYKARPKIALPVDQVIKLDDASGLHPRLTAFSELYGEGHLGLIQGVGYPNPNRSHFRSTEIWQTASDADRNRNDGWLGRYFDSCCRGSDPNVGVAIGGETPQAFGSPGSRGMAISDPEQFRYMMSSDRIPEISGMTKSTVDYPRSQLGNSLNLVSRLIAGGLPTRVYYVSQGGFDTHANQLPAHERLMTDLNAAISAFVADLKAQGNFNRVLMLSFSEFGRRVSENASGGTDHGAAAPLFVLGGGVKPGLYGKYPSLTDLHDGDLKFTTDFRSVYATLLEKWLRVPSGEILGRTFPLLPFI
jgi:uncharacterized protein (DUF1501 family)